MPVKSTEPVTEQSSRVLIVDDDPYGVLLLETLLSTEGYAISSVDNGQDAITEAIQFRPDVILLDVMMPEVDGYMVCSQLRETPGLQHVPIILITALDDRESRIKGFKAGADEYLAKPVDASELKLRLRTISRLNRFRLLSEQQARFEKIFNHSPDGMAIINDQGELVMTNKVFRGLDYSQCLDSFANEGCTFCRFFAEESRPELRLWLKRLGQGETVKPVLETTIVNSTNGSIHHIELTGSRLSWDGQSLLMITARDVSAKKQLETRVLQMQRLDMLGKISGGVMHDINNLFCALRMKLDMLREDYRSNQPLIEELKFFEEVIGQGGGLLKQILVFGRGEQSNQQEVNPIKVVEDILPIAGKYLSVNTKYPETPLLIRADFNQLQQVFMNLCVNARDAMGGRGRLDIEVSMVPVTYSKMPEAELSKLPEGNYVCVTLKDYGPGIPEHIREHIFEPFFSTKDVGKGTGLGLATVLDVMNRHQGFVTLENAPGAGACFKCYFPPVK